MLDDHALPRLFTPFDLRGRTFRNRVVISPMCQHGAQDGHVTDWHVVHYGKFALGGAALAGKCRTARGRRPAHRGGVISPR